MNNTLLPNLDIDPSNFKETIADLIPTNDGFIYELQEGDDGRICLYGYSNFKKLRKRSLLILRYNNTQMKRDTQLLVMCPR